MKLAPEEREISGRWLANRDGLVPDEASKRIEWLKSNYLQRVASDETGWDTLYRDPEDGRYWELIYLESSAHGGGLPTMRYISDEMAIGKYKLK